MKATLILIISIVALQLTSARDFREFTNLKGVKINAEVLELEEEGSIVRIRSRNKVFKVPVDTLSQEDKDWLEEWDLKRKGDLDKLYYKEVMFEDDFSETGEGAGGFDKAWGHYKSESVIQDGVMIGKTVDINVHAGCDSVKFEGRQDMEVAVKFNFVGEEAERFNVWFDDKDFKGSHAGHICSISFSPKGGSISDAKTGNFKNEIYEKRKLPEGIDDETKKMLESKTTRFELDLDREKWYEMLIRTKGDEIVVKIDGEVVGEFKSEGVGHLTKSLVSLTTNVNDVHYDDFVVKAAPPSKKKKEEDE